MGAIGLANIACGFVIIIYAWNRFNTPPTNRSSTRRVLYWWSCAGYILCAVGLFAALSTLLHVTGFRELLGLKDEALPDPLVATLAMTTLLPSLPLLKQVDAWLLAVFFDWGAIPAEARRRSAELTPHGFAVTARDLRALRDADEGQFGDNYTTHLRDSADSPPALSELRFTRVMKLFAQLEALSGQQRYERFFEEAKDEFAAIRQQIAEFAPRAIVSLDRAALTPGPDPGPSGDVAFYTHVMAEWHDRFAQDCRDCFIVMARFLASAVLRAEPTEREIVERLHKIGFTSVKPNNLPEFPIDSLTLLGLGITFYLVVGTVAFAYRAGGVEHAETGLLLAGKIGVARLLTIALTIWLMQRHPFFRREPGRQRPYFAYLVNATLAGCLAALLCLPFDLVNNVPPGIEDARVSVLSGIVCFAIAVCCDSWVTETAPPRWVRPLEALACGAAMALGTLFFYAIGMRPFPALPVSLRRCCW